MRALLPLLACLMLVIASLSSDAHVSEAPEAGITSAELAVWHSAGDGDEVPADSDKNYPHHHAICHGHDVAATPRTPAAPVARAEKRPLRPTAVAALTPRIPDITLRPPIA